MAGGDTGAKKTKSEPNVVPLCDILLVLLIIFMVVTPMIKKGANVALPQMTNTQDQPEPGNMLTVFVEKTGAVTFEGAVVEDISKLAMLVEEKMDEKKQTDSKILLNADKECEYGKVIDVMNEIRNANIEIIGLVTEKSSSN